MDHYLRHTSTCARLVITNNNRFEKENPMDSMPTYNKATDTALGAALALQEYLDDLGSKAGAAMTLRDKAIRDAHNEGVTAYRISKSLGIAESTVGRIVNRA